MRTRFGALDALRGMAALAVVMFHLGEVKLVGDMVPRAYLAVDFFFALSGFVIAYTYEEKLRAGMSVPDFLLRRFTRLYPTALLAVSLGAAVLLLKAHLDPARVDPLDRLLAGVVANLAMLPDPFGGPASLGFLFPGDGPLWSISLEIFINVVWCLMLARARSSALVGLAGTCLVVLTFCIARAGTANLGFDWQTLPGGLARIGFDFSLGVLLYRSKHRIIFARATSLKVLSALLLAGVLAAPRVHALGAAWDIACIVIVMPIIVILGLNGSDHLRLDTILGDASYPLYAIHFPILLLASGVHQKVPRLGIGPLLAGTILVMAVATWAAMKLYDEPVRRALASRWLGNSPRRAQAAAVATV